MKDKKRYLINNFRKRKIVDGVLITTDNGSWCLLGKNDVKLLENSKPNTKKELFNLLKEKGVIITEENQNIIIERLRKKYEFLWIGTSRHIVIPTLRCNQKCVYCHASSKALNAKDYDMDKQTARATVEFIFQSPSPYITIEFQGGEPLLRFDLVREIIEYAIELNKKHQKELLFDLVTNFSLMDEEKLKYLIEKKVGICTSLDGPAFLHNRNRGLTEKGGSYDYVVRWIKRISEEYKKRKINDRRVAALITITKYSLPYWKEIVDEYKKLNLDFIFFRFLNNLGDARPVWMDISYSAKEYIDFWKKAVDYVIEQNKKGVKIREWLTWIMLKKIIKNEEPSYFEQRSPCGAVIGQLAYNYNGDIYTCDEARMINEDIFRLGNVKKDRYKEISQSNQTCAIIANSINDTQICDACAYKPYCGLCPVCNYAEQGNVIAKIPQSSRCKIYKAHFDYIFNKIINDKEAKKVLLSWLDSNT